MARRTQLTQPPGRVPGLDTAMRYYPHNLDGSSHYLRGQFILTRRAALVPQGWTTTSHGPWALAHSEPLCRTGLAGLGGRALGWVLGHAVHPELGYLQGDLVHLGGADLDFQEFVRHLTGRFVAIDLRGGEPQVYLDAYGMLAAVYAPAEDTVASTGSLIPVSPATAFNTGRILATDIPYRNAMYPLGLTPRDGVERLLPNHILDLADWTPRRYWPRAAIGRTADPHEVASRTGAHIADTLRAVSEVMPLQIPLTAGLDSRLLLACAASLLERTEFFTADLGDADGYRDLRVASLIAARCKLRHRIYPWRRPRRRDLTTWAARTGAETGEPRGWRASRTLAEQSAGRASMTGFVGELARAYWWNRMDTTRAVTPEIIVWQCRIPLREEFLARAARWLEGLPPLDLIATMDLLYLEQRGGCWAGVVEYGELGDSSARLAPMCQGALVEDLLRLPEAARREQFVHREVIRTRWPELLEFPFNDEYDVPPLTGLKYSTKAKIHGWWGWSSRVLRRTLSNPAWLFDRSRVA